MATKKVARKKSATPKKNATKKKAVAKQISAGQKKTVTKKTTPKKQTPPRTKSSPKRKTLSATAQSQPKVRVQMFRQGLGDSFLITFDHDGQNEKRMLIDCGSLGSSSTTKISDVTNYIDQLIQAGKRIDILVATHEHKDHLSAFHSQKMKSALTGNVDHVWLAWTEDPTNKLAQKIAKFEEDIARSLLEVANFAANEPVTQQVADLLEFSGDVDVMLGADFAKTVHASMEFVRTETGAETTYLEPGEIIGEDLLPGFRIYVLGPPQDDAFLKNLGSHHDEELFGVAASLLRTAARHSAPADVVSMDDDLPFDVRFNQSGQRLREEQYASYNSPDEVWRQIEFDWINGASELALQLDSLTNNTSLALAIERIADGKVLLFPADAQLGNWLSWHAPDRTWTVTENGIDREVTIVELLNRTVFYKVGHHGSHNATAKGKGLELMTQQDELVAFIPVDRAIALNRNPKDSWQMPARPLYLELLNRCQGRVVRADTGWAQKVDGTTDGDVEHDFLKMGTNDDWKEWTNQQRAAKHVYIDDDLFCEYILE